MTAPSLTYGHGYLTDCDSTTDWSADGAHEDGNTATLTVDNGDIFNINVTVSAGNKSCYYEYNMANITSETYPQFILRYKTSGGIIKAKIVLIFTVGTQVILDETNNTTWTTLTGEITDGKTIDKIRLYATQHTGDVFYDFILLHKGTFTFPHCHVLPVEFENVYADLHPLGRVGDIQQYAGMKSPTIMLEGKLDIGTDSGWGVPPLEYIYRIFQEAHQDPWQWFSTGGLEDEDRIINCKVTPRKFRLIMDKDSGAVRGWRIFLKHFSLSSGSESTWSDLQWLGI